MPVLQAFEPTTASRDAKLVNDHEEVPLLRSAN